MQPSPALMVAARRRRESHRLWHVVPEPVLLRMVSLVGFVVLWESAAALTHSFLMPPIPQVGAAWLDLVQSGDLASSLGGSLRNFAIGTALAVLVGTLMGLAMGTLRSADRTLSPFVNALMAAPHVAFVPVFMIWFGLGDGTRVAVVFSFAFFAVTINVIAGVRSVDPQLTEMARSLSATTWQRFTKVTLPAALPTILAGIRLGIGLGLKGMVTGEVLVVLVGLGAMIRDYGSQYAMDYLYAVIFTVVAIALLLAQVIDRFDRRLNHWRRSGPGRRAAGGRTPGRA